jgi:hypothetical protein
MDDAFTLLTDRSICASQIYQTHQIKPRVVMSVYIEAPALEGIVRVLN